MQRFEVGDLVRDKLNNGAGSYGLGVVVQCTDPMVYNENSAYCDEQEICGLRFDVYFNKFGRIITFHGDYLEKI